MEIIQTLKNNKNIVIGGGLGIYLAPLIETRVAALAPSLTGTPLGKCGLSLVLAGATLALAGTKFVPTTAAAAASTPFLIGAIRNGLSVAGLS